MTVTGVSIHTVKDGRTDNFHDAVVGRGPVQTVGVILLGIHRLCSVLCATSNPFLQYNRRYGVRLARMRRIAS
jgi:hypothetical protein